MNHRQLERAKQLFIDAGEWKEVSKIQYQLECLPKDVELEPEHELEDWMYILLFWQYAKALNNALKIFYSEMGGEHADYSEPDGY